MALLRSSLIIGVNTLLARVLGYGRDILIARALGTTGIVEAFVVAFRFPNLFRRMVAEGAFSAAFVPIYAKKIEREGKESALDFAGNALSWLLLILAVFVALAEIFMPWVVAVIAPGFISQPELFDLAVLFTRLTLPYLVAMAVVALMSGMLNANYKFAMAAAAPTLLNAIFILGLLFATPWFASAGHMLSWVVAIAGIVQYLWLGYACWKAGLRLRLPWPHATASIGRLMRLMGPGLLSGGMTQINIVVGTIVASYIAGAVSVLYFADRLYQFPLSMIGVAIGTALLPELARKLHSDPVSAMAVQNRAIELSMFLTLPAAAALMAIAEPIVLVLFQYGKFTHEDAEKTAWALAAFSSGLPAYVLIRVLSPGFYAREDTRTPVIYAIASMATNIAVALLLVWPPFGLRGLGYLGIPVATALAAWLNAGLLAASLLRRGHWRLDAEIRRRLPRLVLATILMAAPLLPAWLWLQPRVVDSTGGRAVVLAGLVAGGGLLYAVLCLALGAAGLADVKAVLRRRKREPGEKNEKRAAPPPSFD
jgi:putative peptidoglycan lipid II flippase